MIWKITVIAINVFIPRDQPFLKLAAGFAFLVVFFWIQITLWPYWSNVHNVLEQREIICSIVTLYTAVYFNAGGGKGWVNSVVLIGVVMTNIHFFTLLVFCFMRIPNFSKLPKRIWIYEIKYLKFMKILKWITLTDK